LARAAEAAVFGKDPPIARDGILDPIFPRCCGP
jgi:hypothetical protein